MGKQRNHNEDQVYPDIAPQDFAAAADAAGGAGARLSAGGGRRHRRRAGGRYSRQLRSPGSDRSLLRRPAGHVVGQALAVGRGDRQHQRLQLRQDQSGLSTGRLHPDRGRDPGQRAGGGPRGRQPGLSAAGWEDQPPDHGTTMWPR
ncbi:MAG: hypothetical protein V9H69_22510 [Anaerolineae bacterium]